MQNSVATHTWAHVKSGATEHKRIEKKLSTRYLGKTGIIHMYPNYTLLCLTHILKYNGYEFR